MLNNLSKNDLIWIIKRAAPSNLDELVKELAVENKKKREEEAVKLTARLEDVRKEYNKLCDKYNSKNPFDTPVDVLKKKTDLMNEISVLENRLDFLRRNND